ARRFDVPVVLHTRVERLCSAGGRYVLTTDGGRYLCDNVVVATGTFGRTPDVPAVAAQLDPAILQLHSSQYRRPGARRRGEPLRDGHRLRGGSHPPDRPRRSRLRRDPAPARVP